MKSNSLLDQASARTKTRPLIAVVGNPNAGKTTLFNALTGSHQRVGNYPGVTVEKVSGDLKLASGVVECLDVPGMYSLSPVSEDERVATDAITGVAGNFKPDLLVVVVDSTNLERNLYLFSMLALVQRPMVVALSMVDRLRSSGREVDLAKLTNLLGVEVVPVVGHKEKGLQDLKEAIERNLEEPRIPTLELVLPNALAAKVAGLKERLARQGMDVNPAEIAEELVHPTEKFEATAELAEAFHSARESLAPILGEGAHAEVAERYRWASMVQRAAITTVVPGQQKSLSDKVDLFLTHRVFGLIVFIAIMLGVFESIYTLAQPLMDLIKAGFDALGGWIGPHLEAWPSVRSLIVDGLIGGVGGMLVFLPQIAILFFFISLLEGTGYLARAAFLMDRLLGWCGLNGRAFIPLLSSFACAIPGIMSARVMPDAKSRLATILVAPLMSCSARLPVYVLMIGAFIEPKFGKIWAGFTLFAMHLLGLAVAIPIVWFVNRKMLKGNRLPFHLELPPYQFPKWRDVWLAIYFRARVFVHTAGTIIVVMSILIWALSYFPRSTKQEAQYRSEAVRQLNVKPDAPEIDNLVAEKELENSYLGRFGRTVEPVFRPAGFDWRLTTAILSAFPARETVVPSLAIMFNQGKDESSVQDALATAKWPDGKPLLTTATSIAMMVFFALCCQCTSTLAVIKRETNSVYWPLFVFTYMTTLAYVAAIFVQWAFAKF